MNNKIIISKLDFNQESLNNFNHDYSKSWPVNYILKGKNEIYIGETTNFKNRMKNHLVDEVRKNIEQIFLISHEHFNISATKDIESSLIEYFSAIEDFKLQNNNGGSRGCNYYNRPYYQGLFEDIWSRLIDLNLANWSLRDIENTELFKMSPYKKLTDEQFELAENIKNYISKTSNSIHIINGAPGTGKTILAIYLMKLLSNDKGFKKAKIGLVVPMASLRKTIKRVFKNIEGLKANMVIGPSDVVKDEKYDLLIVDEAHRLTKRWKLQNHGSYDKTCYALGIKKEDISSTTQLDWIKKSSKHFILFYDEKQTIKSSDINKSDFNNLNAKRYTLKTQFRVKAGEQYPEYIENIFKQKQEFKNNLEGYDLKIFDNVNDMIENIKKLNKKEGLCRNVAGYSWKWISKKNIKLKDIVIDGHEYQWNSTSDDWINSSNSSNEIGCIHTVQGHDLNYCGVIIGNDLVMKNGKILYNSDEYKDPAKDVNLTNEEMLNYIINTYKVLMTRGIQGTYVYVCDENLREYLKKFIDTY